jgi:hypothetical protein
MPSDDAVHKTVQQTRLAELRARYSWHLDHGEWREWAELFTTDAEVNYGSMDPLVGREEIYEFGREVVAEMYSYSMHTAQVPRFDIDGDETVGQWYLLVFYEMPDGTAGHVGGTYTDEYRYVDGEWKFAAIDNEIHFDTAPGEPHLS